MEISKDTKNPNKYGLNYHYHAILKLMKRYNVLNPNSLEKLKESLGELKFATQKYKKLKKLENKKLEKIEFSACEFLKSKFKSPNDLFNKGENNEINYYKIDEKAKVEKINLKEYSEILRTDKYKSYKILKLDKENGNTLIKHEIYEEMLLQQKNSLLTLEYNEDRYKKIQELNDKLSLLSIMPINKIKEDLKLRYNVVTTDAGVSPSRTFGTGAINFVQYNKLFIIKSEYMRYSSSLAEAYTCLKAIRLIILNKNRLNFKNSVIINDSKALTENLIKMSKKIQILISETSKKSTEKLNFIYDPSKHTLYDKIILNILSLLYNNKDIKIINQKSHSYENYTTFVDKKVSNHLKNSTELPFLKTDEFYKEIKQISINKSIHKNILYNYQAPKLYNQLSIVIPTGLNHKSHKDEKFSFRLLFFTKQTTLSNVFNGSFQKVLKNLIPNYNHQLNPLITSSFPRLSEKYSIINSNYQFISILKEINKKNSIAGQDLDYISLDIKDAYYNLDHENIVQQTKTFIQPFAGRTITDFVKLGLNLNYLENNVKIHKTGDPMGAMNSAFYLLYAYIPGDLALLMIYSNEIQHFIKYADNLLIITKKSMKEEISEKIKEIYKDNFKNILLPEKQGKFLNIKFWLENNKRFSFHPIYKSVILNMRSKDKNLSPSHLRTLSKELLKLSDLQGKSKLEILWIQSSIENYLMVQLIKAEKEESPSPSDEEPRPKSPGKLVRKLLQVSRKTIIENIRNKLIFQKK